MNWSSVGDYLGMILLILGALLTLITALGQVRFNSLFARMHAATKPQVLGLILLVSGLSLILWKSSVTLTLILVVVFQLVTAPISAHMLGRRTYRSVPDAHADFAVDEYTEDILRAEAAQRSDPVE